MAWTHRATTNVATASNLTQATVTKPAGTAANDLLYAITRSGSSAQIITSDSGLFTEISRTVGSTAQIQTWMRVAGASEPASYAFTSTAIGSQMVICSCFTPPSDAPFLDVHAEALNATNVNICAPSIVPTSADALIVWGGWVAGSSSGITPPTGFTEPTNGEINATSVRMEASYLLTAGAVATGDKVGVSALTGANIGTLTAFKTGIVVSGTDTAPIASSATATIFATPTGTDIAPVASADTVSLTATVTGADTGPIASSTAAALALSGPTDSTVVSATETAAVNRFITATDTGAFLSTETASIGATVAASDAGALLSTESASIAAIGVATETGALLATEAVVQIALTAADSGALMSATAASVDTGGVEASGSDSGLLTATENAAVTVTTLALTGSESAALTATETASVTPSVSATDIGAMGSSETATVTTVFLVATGSDSGVVASTATASLAATAAGSDLGSIQSAGAATVKTGAVLAAAAAMRVTATATGLGVTHPLAAHAALSFGVSQAFLLVPVWVPPGADGGLWWIPVASGPYALVLPTVSGGALLFSFPVTGSLRLEVA